MRGTTTERGWALPPGAERDGITLTPIGTLDGAVGATVDPRGLVTVADGGWSLDWWVGADDRWHLASQEPGARQALVDGAPVVETRLRLPGGDAVHRAWVARDGSGDEHVVVEVANETSVPFALAWVLRPIDAHGVPSAAAGLRLDDSGCRLLHEAHPVLLLARPPARAAGSTGGADLVEVVTSGAAPAELGAAADGPEPSVALVVPVTHRTQVRVLLPVDGTADTRFRDDLPDVDQVVSGWALQAGRGARFDLPDVQLGVGVVAARCQVLAVTAAPPSSGRRRVDAVGDFGALARTLDQHGFSSEAEGLLARLSDVLPGWRRPAAEDAAVALAACAFHGLAREGAPSDDRLATMAALARRAERAQVAGPAALDGFARLLARAGQGDAAERVRRGRPGPPPAGPDAWERLRRLGADASPTWAWPHPHDHRSRLEFLAAVRDVLVHDGPDGLRLMPVGAGPWWAQSVAVHDLPTTHGLLSFAVRWHGERPALLWEVEPTAGAGSPHVTTGLDPTWSASEPRGEALLGPVSRPDGVGGPRASAPGPGQGSAESVAPRSVLPLAPRPAPSGDLPDTGSFS